MSGEVDKPHHFAKLSFLLIQGDRLVMTQWNPVAKLTSDPRMLQSCERVISLGRWIDAEIVEEVFSEWCKVRRKLPINRFFVDAGKFSAIV